MDGKAIKKLRLSLKMSQDELARYLGLRHRSQVAHLESGRSAAYGSKAILLAGLAACASKAEAGVPPPGSEDAPPSPAEVRAFRKRCGWSQAQFSDELGLGGPGNTRSVECGQMRLVGPTLRLYRTLEAQAPPPAPATPPRRRRKSPS